MFQFQLENSVSVPAGGFARSICGNRQACYTQYKYGTTLLAEKNVIFQCELFKVGKKSRKFTDGVQKIRA